MNIIIRAIIALLVPTLMLSTTPAPAQAGILPHDPTYKVVSKTVLVFNYGYPSYAGVKFKRSRSLDLARSAVNDGATAAASTLCGAAARISVIVAAVCVGFVVVRMGHVRDAARYVRNHRRYCLQVQIWSPGFFNTWKPLVVARKCAWRRVLL